MKAVRLAALVLPFLAASSWAQDRCEDALREAERSYRGGRIEEVLALRAACIEGRSTRSERVRAWALLAKAHLALDEYEEASAALQELLELDPAYRPAPADPLELARMIEAAKDRFTVRVGTVSKTDEPLREAPATVIVVAAEEIARRGYLDLEQLLHDLPGFDVSRGNGDVYSNVYMRGYRSDRSDRLLFLVDGVEQNDLHSNTAYISRQYPLSNVAQVEVVYGPASTIYGANAFTGVISVTTKPPSAYLAEGKSWGGEAQITSGSYGTRSVDATVAGRSANGLVSWSLSGRIFESDEPDLSGFSEWDYDVERALDEVDYRELMRIEGPLAQALGAGLIEDFFCPDTGWCEVVRADGEIAAIELTEAGEEEARRRDRELFLGLGERDATFSDRTEDWAVDAQLRFGNLTFGLETWRRQEATAPWYTDFLRAGRDNVWPPSQTAIHARYTHPIGRGLLLQVFSRFQRHQLDRGSITRFLTYAGQALNIAELVAFEDSSPALQTVLFDQESTQFRNEVTLVYEPSARFDLVGGLEYRSSSVQVEFRSAITEQSPSAFAFFATQLSDSKAEVTDVGLYAQASYRLRDDLKLVFGGRLDTNAVRGGGAVLTFDVRPTEELTPGQCSVFGLGPPPCDLVSQEVALEDADAVFNPRLAVVHSRGDFVWKAIYSEAFKEPSNFQRYTREPGVREFANPALAPEKVRNLELGFNWQPNDRLFVDAAAYQAGYSNAVALRQQVEPLRFPTTSGRFENIGRLRVRGLQAHASYRIGGYEIYGNYTYAEPANVDPTDDLGNPIAGVDELRVGDIARHRWNLGACGSFGDRWGVSLRSSYVGARQTGAGTTVDSNPLAEIDAYFVTHATVSYRGLLPGATWQLIVDNLFDTAYEDPGVQRAGVGFAARLPQPGRSVYLRLVYRR